MILVCGAALILARLGAPAAFPCVPGTDTFGTFLLDRTGCQRMRPQCS